MRTVRSSGKHATGPDSAVGIYPGRSLRDAVLERPWMTTGGLLKVKSPRPDAHDVGETCVVRGREVCFSLAKTR